MERRDLVATLDNRKVYGKTVREFGADGDGVHNDAPAFQKAFDSEEELIVIPFGKYVIGSPLKVGSNKRIVAHPRARIVLGNKACTKRGDFLLTNKDHKDGNRNIEIRGGIWDGNNLNNPKSELYDKNGYSGSMLCFMNVKNLTLAELTLVEAAAFFVRLCQINDFLIEKIRFAALNICPNNDGIHLGGFCENGIIRDIKATSPGTTNDDLIALNADDCIIRVENLDMKCGYIRNLYIDDIYAEECHSFVRLLSVDSDISNVTINNVRGGFKAAAVNMDAARYCRTPLIAKDDKRYIEGVGNVKSVWINNMHVYCTNPAGNGYLWLESNMDNFKITNFKRLSHLEAYSRTKTLEMKNVGRTEVLFEGLDESDANSLEITSDESLIELSRIVSPQEKLQYKATVLTFVSDKLTLNGGSFKRLVVTKRN